MLFSRAIEGLHYPLINMKGTFIIHLRADEKCIWVQWKRKKNCAGAAAVWVPCWWKGKNKRFNPTDLCVKMKKRTRQANINWKPAWQNDWFTCQYIIRLVILRTIEVHGSLPTMSLFTSELFFYQNWQVKTLNGQNQSSKGWDVLSSKVPKALDPTFSHNATLLLDTPCLINS